MRLRFPFILMGLALGFSSCRSASNDSEKWAQQLGQNILVGVPTPKIERSTREALKDIRPAGIIIYRRNVLNYEQLKRLIAELQEIAKSSGAPRYFILLDEEPGGAQRLGLFGGPYAVTLPSAATLDKDMLTLNDLGVDVLLSPLADYPFNHQGFIRSRLRLYPTVNSLVEFNRLFITTAGRHGISTTLKHFPGMGVFQQDPHQKLPQGPIDEKTLKTSLKIFEDGFSAGAEFVMTGHALYDTVDAAHPATLSKTIVQDMLRHQMRFKGLIMTDDFASMAYSSDPKLNKVDASAQALLAGHNLVMFSHEIVKTRGYFYRLLEKMKVDPDFRDVVRKNYEQVMEFKRK